MESNDVSQMLIYVSLSLVKSATTFCLMDYSKGVEKLKNYFTCLGHFRLFFWYTTIAFIAVHNVIIKRLNILFSFKA